MDGQRLSELSIVRRQAIKRVIRIPAQWDARGFYELLNTGSGVALPGNNYVVTDEQIAVLREKGIPFVDVAVAESAGLEQGDGIPERV